MEEIVYKLLDRELARAQIEPIRAVAGPLLRDVIDEGVGVFSRCAQTGLGGDADLGILFPFHHVLEMTDGVYALLDVSAVAASQPILRSAFEALVGLKYVLAADTERRGLCYVVADVIDRIRWYDSMDPRTTRGEQFIQDMNLAAYPDYPIPRLTDVEESRSRLQEMLSRVPFLEHTEEYERTRKTRRGTPNWYSLYDGPPSFRDLSKATGDLDDYLVLYQQWSKTTHAVDLRRQLGSAAAGTSIRVIRAPGGIEQRYLFAIYFALEATRNILHHYRPEELPRHGTWYRERISARLEALEGMETSDD